MMNEFRRNGKLVGSTDKGKIFVLSAPAGTGKTTLVRMLTEEFPQVIQSISYTSREPRPHERTGVDYHFVAKEKFKEKITSGDFLEHAVVYEDYYGTDQRWVEERLKQGKHVFLVIDTQGARQLMGKVPAVFIFVYPPSFEELKTRLEERKTESSQVIEERLSWSRQELEAGKLYQYNIVNDDLNIAYQVLRSIVIAEDHSKENIYGI
jgi:guanylate kinase